MRLRAFAPILNTMAIEALTRPELLFETAMAEPQLVDVRCGIVAFFSHPCPGREDSNEDALAIIPIDPDSAVLAVADGVGGASAGEVAARTALSSLADALQQHSGENLRSAILDGLEQANQRVIALGGGAATTISVVEIAQGVCRPYHVGDSLILLLGGRGRIKCQSIPHSPVGYGIEAGLLDEKKSLHHKDRHLVSNFVGSPEMRIEIGAPVRLSSHDTLVIASDGLADNLSVADIIGRVRKGRLELAAAQLAQDALGSMVTPRPNQPSKPDDLTFILFRPDKALTTGFHGGRRA